MQFAVVLNAELRENMEASAPPRRGQKGQRITVSLSQSNHAELTKLAQRHDVSISWLARQALVDFIDKYKDAQAKLPLHITK